MSKRMMATLVLLLGMLQIGWTQNTTVKGFVKNSKTREALSGVNIVFPELGTGCETDKNGHFTIAIPQGSYTAQVSFVGYKTKNITVKTNANNKVVRVFLEETTTDLDEVRITGNRIQRKGEATTKIDLPLKDVPMTVSTVNAKLLNQTQIISINDAVRYATGVKGTSNYGGFQTFKFRGLGRPVIMVDGALDYRMVFSNSAPVTTLTAVEQIEYLKGPASVTHGHSADGGILNIVRKQPTKKTTVNFSAYTGSWNNKGAIVGAGGKLSDKLTYRFDAGVGDQDGWRDYAQKYANVYTALDYTINEQNKLEFRFGANKDFYATESGIPVFTTTIYDLNNKAVYQKGNLPQGAERSQRYNDPQDFLNNKNKNGGLNYIHHFSETSKLNFRSSYTDDDIDYFSTEELTFPTSDQPIYSHYYTTDSGAKKYIAIDSIKRSFPFRFEHTTKTFQSSLDYTTKLLTGKIKHNLLAGYTFVLVDRKTFRTKTGKDITGSGKYATISVIDPILNQGNLSYKFSGASIYNETTNSFYVQDLMEFSKQLKALVALRLDHYDMASRTAEIKTGKHLTNKTDKVYQAQTPLTYRFGLVYEPITDLSFYASYSNYFRPNRSSYSSNSIYLDENGNEFTPNFFDPEKGYQVEGGVKYAIANKLQVNASIYYIKKENIVEFLTKTTAGNPVYGQVGQAESKGLELDVDYQPINGWSIKAGYTLSDAKYTDFSISKYQASNEGNYLKRNPKNQFFAWSYYKVPKGVLQNFNLGIGANYSGKMFTNASNSNELPSYWLTEVALGYEINNLYFKFKINNLFDEEYFSNSIYGNQYFPGAERNFLFTVGYKL